MVNELRVWEDTWTQEHGVVTSGLTGHCFASGDEAPPSDQALARLRLAAKAPEMARMLMILAGMGTDKFCNGCGDTDKRGHKRDCALMQLLYDAGVGCLAQADRSPCLALVK